MAWEEDNQPRKSDKEKKKSPWARNEGENSGSKQQFDPQVIVEMLKNSSRPKKPKFGDNGGGNNGGNNNFPKDLFPNPEEFKKFLPLVIIGVLVLWIVSGFYIVQEGEQAVVTRFGKFVRVGEAGPNYHLPYPIETHETYPVARARIEEIGFRSSMPNMAYDNTINYSARLSNARFLPEESLMLTGDENLLAISFVVLWKINNLENYVFKINDPQQTVKNAAESAMREIIGKTTLVDAQTAKRSIVEENVKTLLQQILNNFNAGIEIVGLQMLKIDPPQEVVDAFRDVQTARTDRERAINEAYAYSNDILPRARGEAARIIQDAEGYKEAVIAKATGEVSRFESVLSEYNKAKEVTKQRIYIDTMEELYGNLDKIIIDSSVGNKTVPYLPLPQLVKENKQ